MSDPCPPNSIDALQARVRELEAQLKDLKTMLENLTPGGSEFHDDPKRCFEYALERQKNTTEMVKQGVMKTRTLEAELATLRNVEPTERARIGLLRDVVQFLEFKGRPEAAAELRDF